MLIGLLNVLLVFCAVFLIFLVLIQRGKGGGLAGAFGGVGGSSAFGTKAGDVFTKVTMWVACVWIALSMVLVLLVNAGHKSAWGEGSTTAPPLKKDKEPPPVPIPAPPPGGTSATSKDAAGNPILPKAPLVAPAPAPAPITEPAKVPAQPLNPGDPLPPLPLTLPTKPSP